MKYILLFFIALAVLLPTSAYALTITYPKSDNLPAGSGDIKGFGTTTSNNVSLTKYLQLYNVHSISLIAFCNVSFANGNILVSVSPDNVTYHQVDSVAEGTGAIKGIFYSDAVKATSVPINPALFPYLKIVVPDPGPASLTSLTWSSGNEGNIS